MDLPVILVGWLFLFAVLYSTFLVMTVALLHRHYKRMYKVFTESLYEGYCQMLQDQGKDRKLDVS